MTKGPWKTAAHDCKAGEETLECVLATIGKQLKAVRLEENLSQQELANRSGVSRSAVQRLERGGGLVETFIAILMELGVLDEMMDHLKKGISLKVKNKVRRGGRASSRSGFSK
jgi:transcriptional regulator with XRE-family HTH domain